MVRSTPVSLPVEEHGPGCWGYRDGVLARPSGCGDDGRGVIILVPDDT
jgi:hypothetical protein